MLETQQLLCLFGLNVFVESENFFRCPPDNLAFYASYFIIKIPAILLFPVTLLLHNGIWNFFRGCSFHTEPEKEGLKRFCCCLYPRWGCYKSLIVIIYQSFLAVFFFMDFLNSIEFFFGLS